MKRTLILSLIIAGCVGCATLDWAIKEIGYIKDAFSDKTIDEVTNSVPTTTTTTIPPITPTTTTTTTTTTQPPGPKDAISASDIQWLGVNVGEWAVTYDLAVRVQGNKIFYTQDATSRWPTRAIPNRSNGVANPWVIRKRNGKWVAATHEWMTKGQKFKAKSSVAGDHTKRAPHFPNDWKPKAGEEYGFVVSGLCRGSQRNVRERTNIVKIRWR